MHVVIGRIQSLELAVEKMRQQQDQLQRRLKGEMERKVKLEVRLVEPPVVQKKYGTRTPYMHRHTHTLTHTTTTTQQHATVERNGSGVELLTLDYENPGSNPVLRL